MDDLDGQALPDQRRSAALAHSALRVPVHERQRPGIDFTKLRFSRKLFGLILSSNFKQISRINILTLS
jgi:hypothetical protein